MGTTWRFVDAGPQSPFEAMGRMPVLGNQVAAGGKPVLMTSVWGATHVNVGWFDDVDATLDLEACKRLGVQVVRRPVFGGGTAFYESGCAAMQSFMLDKEQHPDLDAELSRFQPVFKDALARLGLEEVDFEGSSDLRWHGRKIGALVAQDAMTCNVVGSFLNLSRPDVELYLQVARIPDEKFRDKVVKDMREYIVTADEIAGRPISYGEFRDAVVAAVEARGDELVPEPLTDEEKQGVEGIAAMIAADDFVERTSSSRFASGAPAGSAVGFANHKGRKLCRAGVALDEDGTVVAAMMAGDMHVGPPDTMERVADALVGAAASDRDELRARIASVFEADDVHQPDTIMGVTTDDLLTAVVKAVEVARATVGEVAAQR